MTVRLVDPTQIVLEGPCPAADAESLLAHLAASPAARVDWRACQQAHTAVVQVLLAAASRVDGPPAGAFLRVWIEPALLKSSGDASLSAAGS